MEFDFRNTNPGIHLVKSTSLRIFWKRTEAGNVFSFVCYCGRTSQRARPCGFGVESYCPPSEFHKMKHAPSLVAEVLSSEWGILWAGWSTRLRATEKATSYQGDFQGEREIEIQLNGSWKTKGPILPSSFLRSLASSAGGGTLQTILSFEDTPLHLQWNQPWDCSVWGLASWAETMSQS